MKKVSVFLFSIATLLLTVYSLWHPNYLLQELVALGEPFVLARLFLILALFSYMFFPKARTILFRGILLLTGLSAIAFGSVTMFSPMFFGHFSSYVPIGDVFIFLEGGILAMLLVLELPQYTPTYTVPRFNPQLQMRGLLNHYANFDPTS